MLVFYTDCSHVCFLIAGVDDYFVYTDCGMDVHKQCIVTAAEIKCQPNRKMIKKGDSKIHYMNKDWFTMRHRTILA